MKNAIISHNIDFVSFLMTEYGMKIDMEKCCLYHNIQALFVYFDQGNDIQKCIVEATYYDIYLPYEYLITHGIDFNAKDSYGRSVIHSAAANGREQIIEILLSHGIDINSKDERGKTALHYAAMFNRKETAEFLLAHGAEINEKDDNGYTPLYLAYEYNSRDVRRFLISNDAIE